MSKKNHKTQKTHKNHKNHKTHKTHKTDYQLSMSNELFNNIPINPIRQKFYDALNDKDYETYIITLLTIYIELENRLRDFTAIYKDHKLNFKKTKEGFCGELFGGSLFYLIYLEAKTLNIFTPEDKDIIEYFRINKTIDIDARITYNITKWNEEYSDTKKKTFIRWVL